MILPPEYIKEVYEFCEGVNKLNLANRTGELYLQPNIELHLDGRPSGVRLVDDGMGETTYYVEFYDTKENND